MTFLLCQLIQLARREWRTALAAKRQGDWFGYDYHRGRAEGLLEAARILRPKTT